MMSAKNFVDKGQQQQQQWWRDFEFGKDVHLVSILSLLLIGYNFHEVRIIRSKYMSSSIEAEMPE